MLRDLDARASIDGLEGLAVGSAGRRAPGRLPLADGGDGSVEAAVAAGFTAHPVTVAGATGLPHRTHIAFDGTTAIVEVAATCGTTAGFERIWAIDELTERDTSTDPALTGRLLEQVGREIALRSPVAAGPNTSH